MLFNCLYNYVPDVTYLLWVFILSTNIRSRCHCPVWDYILVAKNIQN